MFGYKFLCFVKNIYKMKLCFPLCFSERCDVILQIKLYTELLKMIMGHIPNSQASLQDYVAS